MIKIEKFLDDLTGQVSTVFKQGDGTWQIGPADANYIMKLLKEFYDDAYEKGYSDGEEEDCLVRHEEGYKEGYEVGYEDGYDEGLGEGYDEGINEGMDMEF